MLLPEGKSSNSSSPRKQIIGHVFNVASLVGFRLLNATGRIRCIRKKRKAKYASARAVGASYAHAIFVHPVVHDHLARGHLFFELSCFVDTTAQHGFNFPELVVVAMPNFVRVLSRA